MRIASKYTSTALKGAGFALLALGMQATPTLAKDRPTGSPEEAGLLPGQLANLDAKMHLYVDGGEVGGVVTMIARHGKLVHVGSYGWADRDSEMEIDENTVVRMFSMTKPITSVALLMMYEEGKFQLGDPLEKFIPEFADLKVFAGRDENGEAILVDPKRKPTMHDVFRHTAGFSYGAWEDEETTAAWNESGYGSMEQGKFVRGLAKFPLMYHPGERWFYSYSHDVQAHLVEYFSGMSFPEFVKQRIFDPLDMPSSYFGQPDERPENYATLYLKGEDGNVTAQPWEAGTSYGKTVLGGSGLSSSARDYLQFAQMLLNKGELDGNRLLSPSTVEFMAMDHVPIKGMQVGWAKGRGYGLGVEVVTDPAQYGSPASVGQFGWSGAAMTYFSVDPKEDTVSVLVTQVRPQNLEMYADFVTLSNLAVAD